MSQRNLERARKRLERIANKVGNRRIPSRTFIRMLNAEFRSMKVKFRTRAEGQRFGKFVSLEAFYHGIDREEHEWLYTVNIIKDPKEDTIKPRRHGLIRELLLVLAHEFRHSYQHRKRNYKTNIKENPKFHHFNKYVRDDIRYLIEYDEVDAYAFEAAQELLLRQLTFADLQRTAVYRTMYGKRVKKYAPKHFKRWVRKVYQHINNHEKSNVSS